MTIPVCHVCRGLIARGPQVTLATPVQIWRPRVEWYFHEECLAAWLATATTTKHKGDSRVQTRQAAQPVQKTA